MRDVSSVSVADIRHGPADLLDFGQSRLWDNVWVTSALRPIADGENAVTHFSIGPPAGGFLAIARIGHVGDSKLFDFCFIRLGYGRHFRAQHLERVLFQGPSLVS